MAPKRRLSNRATPYNYDPQLIENWTFARLMDGCKERGISFPPHARRLTLVRLLKAGTTSTENSTVLRRSPDHTESSARSHDSPRGDGHLRWPRPRRRQCLWNFKYTDQHCVFTRF